jgi:hypothetical protein
MLFFVVAKSFDSPLSSHSFPAAVKFLDIDQLFRFVYSGVSSPSPPAMHFNAFFHVFGMSGVVATILTAKNVNVVRQLTILRNNQFSSFSLKKITHNTELGKLEIHRKVWE